MNYQFRAKIADGHNLKILSELVQNLILNASFKLTEEGISLRMRDNQKRVLVDIFMKANNFNVYELEEERYIGINLHHLYKMLKMLKKKDELTLYILEDDPDKLYITISPKEHNRITTSSLQIQYLQNLDIHVPKEYNNSVMLNSTDYQRSLKDMTNINSKTLHVKMKKNSIILSCSQSHIFERQVHFGEMVDPTDVCIDTEFNMELFIKTLKISGLNPFLWFYNSDIPNMPLLLKTNIGQLGTICIYIKSNEQIENMV